MEASGGWQRGMMRHHANSCHSLVQARQPRAAFALAASGRSSSLAWQGWRRRRRQAAGAGAEAWRAGVELCLVDSRTARHGVGGPTAAWPLWRTQQCLRGVHQARQTRREQLLAAESAVAAACIRLEASQMACCISGLVPVLAVDVSISSSQSVRGWRVAGGGGVAAMSKPCARILTPTCGAYVARVVWVLCLFCLSCRCLPLHRAPLVFFVNRDGVASSSEAPRRLCAEVRQGEDLAGPQ